MNPIGSILGALKYMPASVARKALEKVNPGFKNYFAKSISYGVDVNRAIDFLTDRFESESQKTHKQELERGEANNTLRPDEQVSRSQLANQERPGKVLKGAASILGGAGLGNVGENPEVQEQAQEKQQSPLSRASLQEQNQPGSSALNGIEKLFGYIEKRVSAGEPIEKAVSTARANAAFKPIIAAEEQETGIPFIDLVKSKFSGYGQPGQQQSQGGQGSQQRMQQMQQILQALQSLKGG